MIGAPPSPVAASTARSAGFGSPASAQAMLPDSPTPLSSVRVTPASLAGLPPRGGTAAGDYPEPSPGDFAPLSGMALSAQIGTLLDLPEAERRALLPPGHEVMLGIAPAAMPLLRDAAAFHARPVLRNGNELRAEVARCAAAATCASGKPRLVVGTPHDSVAEYLLTEAAIDACHTHGLTSICVDLPEPIYREAVGRWSLSYAKCTGLPPAALCTPAGRRDVRRNVMRNPTLPPAVHRYVDRMLACCALATSGLAVHSVEHELPAAHARTRIPAARREREMAADLLRHEGADRGFILLCETLRGPHLARATTTASGTPACLLLIDQKHNSPTAGHHAEAASAPAAAYRSATRLQTLAMRYGISPQIRTLPLDFTV